MNQTIATTPMEVSRTAATRAHTPARRSVVTSLLSMIVPVTMLIALASTILYGVGHYMTLEERLQLRMEQIAESRARLAGESLWKMRYDQVANVADEMLKIDTVVVATIYDDTGAVVAAAVKPDVVAEREISRPIFYRNGLIDVRAGTLKITYTRAFIWRLLRHELMFPLVLGLATAAAGYAALRIATHIHIGKPLKMLTETIVRSRRDGHHHRASIETDNEFGELAQAFNELQDANAAAVTKLATLASQDALTGLPNRRGLNEKLKQLSQSRISDAVGAARGQGRGDVAVHFIDLDDFKAINDTFGHETGDKFLIHIAEQLRGVIGSEDWIARLGGDEFIVVQRNVAGEDGARALAQRLMAAVSTPFGIGDKRITGRASIGIALGCGRGDADITQLPALADIALYHSKERGTGTISVLNPALLLAHSRGRELEIALPQAFAERQFEVWYQAQFDARSATVCGLEALARWRHPVHGYISPAEFVPLIEKTGHSGRLAQVVLEDACIRARQMRRLGYSEFRIAVNLSPSELADSSFVETLKALTRAHDVAPTTLEIEITEGTLINSVADTSAVIGALRAMGVSVALDDFGTGYSSLAYLRRFPIDKIKIDKAFVRNIAQDADDEAVVEMIAVLAGKLGFKVVAEGIEEPEQLQALRAIGVDMGQGFLFHRPQPFADLEHFLKAQAEPQELPLRASA